MCWTSCMSVPGGKVPIANIFVVGVVGIGVVCDMETPAEATSTEAVVKLRRRRFIQRPAPTCRRRFWPVGQDRPCQQAHACESGRGQPPEPPDISYVRRDRKPSRTSAANIFGCSHAAKCPPFSGLL